MLLCLICGYKIVPSDSGDTDRLMCETSSVNAKSKWQPIEVDGCKEERKENLFFTKIWYSETNWHIFMK